MAHAVRRRAALRPTTATAALWMSIGAVAVLAALLASPAALAAGDPPKRKAWAVSVDTAFGPGGSGSLRAPRGQDWPARR
jgi:hypothetical protein